MLHEAFHQAYRLARLALGCSLIVAASGCATPSLNIVPGQPIAPTVAQVDEGS